MNTKTPIMLLQEFMQKKGILPYYEFINCEGGMFKCRVIVDVLKEIGVGRTKKDAKQNAAQIALEKLHNEGKFFPSGTVINSLKPQNTENWENNVCKLQDLCTEYSLGVPSYDCISETGPPHSKQFIIKCSIGAIIRNGSAGTKKLAKQLAAGKIIEYFTVNVPSRISDIEEYAKLEKLNNTAMEKFALLDPAWRPNLGQLITHYHLGFINSLEKEKVKEVQDFLIGSADLNYVDRIESLLKILSLDCEWSILPSREDKLICLNVMRFNPPMCIIGKGCNNDVAKINTAKEALDHIDTMLLMKTKIA